MPLTMLAARAGRPLTEDSPATEAPESFFRQRGDDHGSSGPSTPGIEPDRVLGDFRLAINPPAQSVVSRLAQAHERERSCPAALAAPPQL
ncbi:MAG: hypothetical protein ACI9EF_002670 [Pseudohongiellaceae bacterium]|jgi:hypothetical protein